MTRRVPWPLLGLAAIGAAALVLGITAIGPASGRAARTEHELVSAARGVVQSTVTGTGNVAASTDVEANFATSGTLQHVDVHEGEHVAKGQLLATLVPRSQKLVVEQDELSLSSAEDQLRNAEDETVTSTSDTSASVAAQPSAEFVDATTTTTTTTTAASPTRSQTAPVRTAPTPTPTVTVTETAPAATAPIQTGARTSTTATPRRPSTSSTTSTGPTATGGSSGASTTAASKAAAVATAKASVLGARANLTSARQGLSQTRLTAPASGTIVSLEALAPGQAVSGSSSAAASSTGSAASSGGSSATSGGNGGGSGAQTSTSSTGTSSTGFAEIVDARKLTMTVAFDESDISKVKVGQPATITVEALTGVELAGHVTSISTVGTESSSVVTYDATIALDQHDAAVKPGMSAQAAVVTSQASGVTLPSAAVSGSGATATVDLLVGGKATPTTVNVGVRGTSRVQIAAGLKAGQQVEVDETLPSSTTSSSSGATGTGGGFGRGGGFGGTGGFGRSGGGGGFARP